jgi:type II secretory pathway pseudopilin PulG
MTLETFIVLGLVAVLSSVAALLWRAGRRRDTALKLSKRALRLQEQLEWDHMVEEARKRS